MSDENKVEASSSEQLDLNTPEGRAHQNVQFALNNPQNIPVKFKRADGTIDVDALNKSYLALEQRQSGGAPDPTSNASTPPSDEDASSVLAGEEGKPSQPSVESAQSILDSDKPESPDINWDSIRAGKITDQDKAALKKMGVPDDIIAGYAKGAELQRQAVTAQAAALLEGGEQELAATLKWARDNRTEAEWMALREAAKGPAGATVLVGLNSEYRKATGQGPSLVEPHDGGGGGPAPSVKPYATNAELQADIQNPKYTSDPDFQRHVAKRMYVTRNPGADIRDFDERWNTAVGRAQNY